MTYIGPRYLDGTAVKTGDRVHLGYPEEQFEVRSTRPEGVAVIAQVTPGFQPLGTSTVPLTNLRFVRRADGSA